MDNLFTCPKCKKVLHLFYTDIALIEEDGQTIALCEDCYWKAPIITEKGGVK